MEHSMDQAQQVSLGQVYGLPGATMSPYGAVLPTLAGQAQAHDLGALAQQLHGLQAWLADDLAAVEAELLRTTGPSLAEHAGRALLQAGGKRLRPICTLLAGRIGQSDTQVVRPALRNLAIAVELVHAATLLHDDVVDGADLRRGQPTARALHGNEVSIFAGDWVLVAALRKIVQSGHRQLVDSALDTLQQMVEAEVEQSQRARVRACDVAGYYRVIEGKTASLFRWALHAGAVAAALPDAQAQALRQFGGEVGLAFQIADDILDLTGDVGRVGKALFADVQEGKLTLPVALLVERKPETVELVRAIANNIGGDAQATGNLCAMLAVDLHDSGALRAAQSMGMAHCDKALSALQVVPACPEVAALREITDALVRRHS